MRVILDECLPRLFGLLLVGHTVTTVPRAGWSGVKNGRLLTLIAGAHDAFITIDRNLPAQQALSGLSFGIIVLGAVSNRTIDLAPLAPSVIATLALLQPGEVRYVP